MGNAWVKYINPGESALKEIFQGFLDIRTERVIMITSSDILHST